MGRLSKKALDAVLGVRDDCKSSHWIKGAYSGIGEGGKMVGCWMGLLNCRLGLPAHIGSSDPLTEPTTGDEWEAIRARSEILDLFSHRENVAAYGSPEEWNDSDDTELADILLEMDDVLLEELRSMEEVPFAPFK